MLMTIKNYESWLNREINITIEELKTMQRYQKATAEGYLLALKKAQKNLRNLEREENKDN